MAIKIIGKSVLGDLGFCQTTAKMGNNYTEQLNKIRSKLPEGKKLIMTSMCGSKEVDATGGEYLPRVRMYDPSLDDMFSPEKIYQYCGDDMDSIRPGADFIVWNDSWKEIAVATFSREAPILYFKSTNGGLALGVIMRKALMRYGEYLFDTIKESIGGDITCCLVTCNEYWFKDGGSIPFNIEKLCQKYDMQFYKMYNSESHSDCYHRGEKGNHVVMITVN